MDSSLIEEDNIQSEPMGLDDIKLGRLELTKPPNAGIWHGATQIELMYNKLSELPPSPNCPLLRVLLLQGNADLMEIPPLFFHHMPLLRTLDLSYTSITDLPISFFGLVELRVLYLRGCELFMELPPEIGQLKNLEELDLNETQITHVPTEIQELINLQNLTLSFYEYDQNIGQVIPKGLISKLTILSYLSIDVNPDHSKGLMFTKKLSLPIYTGTRVLDIDGNPLTIVLVDKNIDPMAPKSLPHPIKLEIVVLDGGFSFEDNETWTSEQFNGHIVKERTGKRPLLTGELNVTMRDGIAPIGDIEFTDNSSWIRSRTIRVAVRVAPGSTQSVRIREGMTEAFVVKDHRGQLFKKHHPPVLLDEVWRLEKIGKDGVFHRKLSEEGINTVQDFLKLSVVDPLKLRKVLGIGMSDKMMDVTINHARTCIIGNKLYVYRGSHFTIVLNPICQLVKAVINGQIISLRDARTSNMNRIYLVKLVREAYLRWNTLEEIDGPWNDNITLLTHGETVKQFPNPSNHPLPIVAYEQNEYHGDKSMEASGSGVSTVTSQVGSNESAMDPYSTTSCGSGITYSISESTSDGDITPSPSWNLWA